ncbi:MAG: glycogen debranching protein GlgX [Methylovulum sp.]|uniref:glycogen debranching protein GlgX n=1 Tax=Methylovulum sp. TaxID=1916980 RepID=UPI00260A50B1|nr:glycogen debranching protein GlgX [Methylovulum sp.]MDD2723166.1 glycogen debranching protein GlgX [Methylovulum sp.]MDD5125625.1 glycogen debranching protein GlgX [Methylovulum sp.]
MASKTTEDFLSLITEDFSIQRGHALPFGATIERGGINFSIYARHATGVILVFFLPGEEDEIVAFPLDNNINRTGDVWHVFIAGLNPGVEYAYKIDGPQILPHRYDANLLLADPYAIALNGRCVWADSRHNHTPFRRAILVTKAYDWEFDQPLNRPLADSIIYELHVRSFTQDTSAQANHPGTFRGLIEKIPYLLELGVTAVELMPVTEFDELDNGRLNPDTGSGLHNLWGYHPLSFFAIKSAYAADSIPGGEINEFKDMVKALHAAGIEVILDVVYNHSGEGDHRGPTYSLKGIDNSSYYMLAKDGSYMNFSGCGNTINCNHPYVRNWIMDSLRYWVMEMHVDGFRFDLASILGRDQQGRVLDSPPLLEQIAGDPVLAKTKLIAEAWDAAGLYQVGSFPNWGRWAEWNGHFRDDVRRFVKGDPGMVGSLANRIAGSSDLYQFGRDPSHGINFITSHDGFTLRDLVSYNEKHNRANGEGNRDGDNNNLSWNCGAEGETSDPHIKQLRERQVRNLATLLLISRGVPMILAGDEMGRTQQGNNNAYCQDNGINWLNWRCLSENKELFRFFRLLIAFRKSHELLRHDSFTIKEGQGLKIDWHGHRLQSPDWSYESRSIAAHLFGGNSKRLAADIYLIANAHWETGSFQLPPLKHKKWHRFIDTSLPGELAIMEDEQLPVLDDQDHYLVGARTVLVLIGR